MDLGLVLGIQLLLWFIKLYLKIEKLTLAFGEYNLISVSAWKLYAMLSAEWKKDASSFSTTLSYVLDICTTLAIIFVTNRSRESSRYKFFSKCLIFQTQQKITCKLKGVMYNFATMWDKGQWNSFLDNRGEVEVNYFGLFVQSNKNFKCNMLQINLMARQKALEYRFSKLFLLTNSLFTIIAIFLQFQLNTNTNQQWTKMVLY